VGSAKTFWNCWVWRVQASGLCLVLLSTHQDAFHSLSDAAKRLQSELQGEGTFQVCCSSSFHTATTCLWPQCLETGVPGMLISSVVLLHHTEDEISVLKWHNC
jgi:hypothetical protein